MCIGHMMNGVFNRLIGGVWQHLFGSKKFLGGEVRLLELEMELAGKKQKDEFVLLS